MLTRTSVWTFVALAGCLIVSSCSNPVRYVKYQPPAFLHWDRGYGYDEVPVDSITYHVMFYGGTPEFADRCTLYRSAELTMERGYDYFVVMDKHADAQTSTNTGSPETKLDRTYDVQSHQWVTVATTTQSVTTSTFYSAFKTIRMFKGKRAKDDVETFDAANIIGYMTPYIPR